MPILGADVRDKLAELFSDLAGDVDLRLYGGPQGEAGEVMRALLGEMAEVSPHLHVVDVADAPEVEPGRQTDAQAEGPILSVAARGDDTSRVRFLGVTSGHEFGSLVAAVRQVARGATDLKAATVEALGTLRHPIHVQVFSTPT